MKIAYLDSRFTGMTNSTETPTQSIGNYFRLKYGSINHESPCPTIF